MIHPEHGSATVDEVKDKDEDVPETNKAINLQNFELFEHMISAHVVLQHVKYKCKKCEAAFTLRQKFQDHLVSHAVQEKNKRFGIYDESLASSYKHNLSDDLIKHITSAHIVLETLPEIANKLTTVSNQTNSYGVNITNENRFIKRHLCKECGQMFVKKSTLDAHAVVHEPYPHICHCGIGFYKKSDLGQHRTLLHLDEVKKELENKSTTREQRALITDLWVPNVVYVKKERTTNGYTSSNKGPRLKAELSTKITKKRVRSSGYTNETYDCQFCDKKFLARCRLTVHMKIHGNKDFRCSYCGKCFNNFHNMKNHERIHTGLKPFACSFCQKGFCDPSARLRHERIHTGVKPYTCKFCGKSFSDASGRFYHEKRHMNDKKFPCEICGKKFYIPHYRDKHMISVHGGKNAIKKYECHLCSKKFLMKSYLYTHIKSHSAVKEFKCHHCSFATNLKNNLKNHIDSQHFKILPRQKCNFCPFTTKHKYILIKHIETHSCNKSLNENTCKTSSKTVKSKLGLAKQPTQRKTLLDCQFCTNKFKKKATLEEHYDKMHNDQKKLECDDCCMKHITKHSLREHIFSEHMEFLYCNVCNRKFFSDTHLKSHKLKSCLLHLPT